MYGSLAIHTQSFYESGCLEYIHTGRTLERFQGIRTLSTERTIIVQAGLWSVFTFTALFYITFYEIVMTIYYYFSTVLY